MNKNHSVLLFVISSFSLYLLFSLLGYALHFKWIPFKKVNLVSDIFKEKHLPVKAKDIVIKSANITLAKPHFDLELYQQPHLITNFNTDTTRPALTAFLQKLHDLKTGKKRKVRIAYFGDSMIEGDLLTQTLRELLQKEFGGSGVGFVPVTSLVSQFRQTVYTTYSDGWENENFKTDGKKNRLFLSGYSFHSKGDWVKMKDETIAGSDTALIEKSLLCGYYEKPVTIQVNDNNITINPEKIFNRIVAAKDKAKSIKFFIGEDALPVYGVSFESESGILLDNFSFRGISGVEFNYIDSTFLSKIAEANPYDLIVFQYGVNVLFRPNDTNFNWYARLVTPVAKKLRSCFPSADLLIVSTADRAFKYEGEYASATGIDSLVRLQASIAYQTGSGFYNQFQTMGGKNSIVDWASQTPPLANKDYVHPNSRGAALLGRYFFDAIMNDYNKYTSLPVKGASK